jgi:hypothetical protein
MKNVPEGQNPLNRSPYCGDPGALVSYLYNDGSPEELVAIATHVQACDACASELAALGDTREVLSAWSPPHTELGLTLSAPDALPVAASVRTFEPAVAANVPWWRQSTPVWMQAVAATMVFAAGMAIGTSGGGTAPAPSGAVANATPAPSGQPAAVKSDTALKSDSVSRSELAALEQRLRDELARLAPASASTPASVQTAPVQTATRIEDEAFMKRVRALLTESEERQRGELALRTAQVMRDMEIQRRVDMATVQQDIDKIQGVTGAELKRQGELQNILINRVGLQGR